MRYRNHSFIPVALVFGMTTVGMQATVPTEFAGTWAGTARIFVNWTAQKTLPVYLTIVADGRVSGTVGDAALRNGRFVSNRGSLLRMLDWKTDWSIVGDLDGPIIEAEGIRRDRVSIPINFVDDHFEGSVNTSGSKFGGKERMWLAAGRLHLDRVTR
jgi:hypothetical protein